jgi:hypothetical protein
MLFSEMEKQFPRSYHGGLCGFQPLPKDVTGSVSDLPTPSLFPDLLNCWDLGLIITCEVLCCTTRFPLVYIY